MYVFELLVDGSGDDGRGDDGCSDDDRGDGVNLQCCALPSAYHAYKMFH